jgi:hypothetical protein
MTNAVQTAVAAYLAGRNRIINGACDIAQRGTSLTLATTAGVNAQSYGGPDRFFMQNSAGGSFSQGQNTLNALNISSILQAPVSTAGISFAGTNLWAGIRQPIEGVHCYDLLYKPMIASFLFIAKLPGNYTFALADSAFTYSFVTSFNYAVADVGQRIVIPIPQPPAAANIPRNSAAGLHYQIGGLNRGTFQMAANPNAWVSGAFMSATGTVDWSTSTSNYICATEMQLEEGVIATKFDRRPFAQEFQLCQRYYQVTGAIMFSGATTSGIGYWTAIDFPVQMRSTPTITGVVLGGGANFPATNPSNLSASNTYATGTTPPANTTGASGTYSWIATLSAEL